MTSYKFVDMQKLHVFSNIKSNLLEIKKRNENGERRKLSGNVGFTVIFTKINLIKYV